MLSYIEKIFDSNKKIIANLQNRVNKILALEKKIEKLSDVDLREKTTEFKNRLQNGETLDSILEEAFAVVREASYRVLGMKHFPVQLMGGIVLHKGDIAEMKTGEGKTLVATAPTYLNALTGEGVFVVTVNEYLAARDREEMGQIFEFLGLSVGLIKRELGLEQRKAAYACDITYGTNSEFGFDYLRDNMAVLKNQVVQRKLNYAIIDEVDSILIDEARTPLIISGQGNLPSQYYITVDRFVKNLKKDTEYEIDTEKHICELTEEGVFRVEKFFGLENISQEKNVELIHHIRQSLQANYMMKKDKDYVVKNGEIVIVDKFTGRLMPGRRFSNGLHQAIEAKEDVEIKKESNTLATITYQNYFRMFNKIAGMTGTADTEKEEFKSIYNIDVVVIPTNKPMIREDKKDIVFKKKEAKLEAIVKEVEKRHQKGQPVLVGTIYIDDSEKLSSLLSKRGIEHKVLNAKQDKYEAEIISSAGQKGAVTIATNMAGRGTDIKLGEGVSELGGLLVIGTEKHDSRRIDNQLRGRSGRQGDPGESVFFVSFEDSIFEKINKDFLQKIKDALKKLEISDSEPINNKMILRFVEKTQKIIESVHYSIRKNTLEFDEILNKQREIIYKERNKILNGEDMSEFIKDIITELVEDAVRNFTPQDTFPEEWDLRALEEYLNKNLRLHERVSFKKLSKEEIADLTREKLIEIIKEEAFKIYSERENAVGAEKLRYLERLILMKAIDRKWMEHLDILEQIRQGIGLQGIGRQAPVRVYNKEAFELFEEMFRVVKKDTIKAIFSLVTKKEVEEMQSKKEVSEENKEKNLLKLEEKYKVERRQLTKIPANMPLLSFNMDINAMEKIDVKVALFYLGGGVEERLPEYDQEYVVEGVFQVQFKKPDGENWKEGWYQVKAFVAGQEATTLNFMISEPVSLESLNRQNIKYFSNKVPAISFNLEVKDLKTDSLKAVLKFQDKSVADFEIPVKDSQVSVKLERPEGGWGNGLYHLILLIDDKEVKVPFIIGD